MVVVEDSAKALLLLNRVVGVCGGEERFDDDVANALMISFCVVVRDILADDGSQMPLAEQHDVVEALVANGAPEPLGLRVEVGTPRGQQQGLDA